MLSTVDPSTFILPSHDPMKKKDNYLGQRCWIPPSLKTGDFCLVNDDCFIGPNVSVGSFSMLAPHVAIVGGDHRYDVVGIPTYLAGRGEQKSTTRMTDKII